MQFNLSILIFKMNVLLQDNLLLRFLTVTKIILFNIRI